MSPTPNMMIVAGEVSGDMRAAGLVAAIRRRRPDIRFFGIGGERMREAGVEIWRDARDMAVMGLSDVLARYPFFKRLFVETLALARTRCPDAVILVDYPGFNLRLAARVRALGLKVIYYVCPQVWAWHSARVPAIARSVDRMLALFPFEPDLFRGTGLRVDFVGHPAVDETQAALAQPPEPLPWKGEQPIALLPGSRFHEVQRILPVLWSAAALVERENPAVGFMVAAPSETMERDILRLLAGRRGPSRWALVTGKTLQVLRQARAALVASGTATLEAALLNCPAVVVYRTSWLTYLPARMLVRTRRIGIVNIIADRSVCPEFIQRAARPAAIAAALSSISRDGAARSAMLAGYADIARRLGPPGAAERAAEIVLEELTGPRQPAVHRSLT